MQRFGYLTITQPEGPVVERDTYLCCHCSRMVVVTPGSGKQRSWCFLCNRGTCGGSACAKGCLPFEARLEAMEGTRRFYKKMDLRGKLF